VDYKKYGEMLKKEAVIEIRNDLRSAGNAYSPQDILKVYIKAGLSRGKPDNDLVYIYKMLREDRDSVKSEPAPVMPKKAPEVAQVTKPVTEEKVPVAPVPSSQEEISIADLQAAHGWILENKEDLPALLTALGKVSQLTAKIGSLPKCRRTLEVLLDLRAVAVKK